MNTPLELLELCIKTSPISHHFDFDTIAKDDTLNINSTEDILEFIKFIQNNS